MKYKFKFTTRKIFKIIFILLFCVNLVTLFYSYTFIKSQVFSTMFMSREELLKQSNIKVEDIDLDKFNKVIEKIDNKQKLEDIKNINPIFN